MGFWLAALVLAALFGASHYFLKPMESWRDGVSVALYGLFWALTLRRTGSLWFAVGFHAMSDYADMIIFAEPNTGNHGQPLGGHLLNVTFHGPDWLTGGPCGTEASAFVFVRNPRNSPITARTSSRGHDRRYFAGSSLFRASFAHGEAGSRSR